MRRRRIGWYCDAWFWKEFQPESISTNAGQFHVIHLRDVQRFPWNEPYYSGVAKFLSNSKSRDKGALKISQNLKEISSMHLRCHNPSKIPTNLGRQSWMQILIDEWTTHLFFEHKHLLQRNFFGSFALITHPFSLINRSICTKSELSAKFDLRSGDYRIVWSVHRIANSGHWIVTNKIGSLCPFRPS